MLHKDFPAELLDAILEAAIRSERLRWRATEPASLNAAVDEFFAWPSALNLDLRTRIRTAAGRALLQKAIIELPADFTNSNSTTDLVLPIALMGNEQGIRHLVLEIKLTARSPACQAQLNKTCRGLGPLSSRLPNLEVFVVSLVLERNQNDDHEAPSFDLGKLDLRNFTSFNKTETLKNTLVRLLDILYAKGPGRRKWVRFIDWRGDWSSASAGPLVRVPEFVAPQAQDGSSEVDASSGESKDPTGPTAGEQVLEHAYRYHRQFLRRSWLEA